MGGFQLETVPPPGRLDGLTCYAANNALAVEVGVTPSNSVSSQVVLPKGHISAGAAFGIFLCVVLIVAAIGGVGYILWQRRVSSSLPSPNNAPMPASWGMPDPMQKLVVRVAPGPQKELAFIVLEAPQEL